MSGRHRKQSTTGRTAAKVAATGALLGGATLAFSAPAANAAPDSQWDQVAKCESGGNWSINTGNGYHGGLQFSPSTWSAYGGQKYAPTANQASKAQQIAIAEKVLAGQGKGAWPSCGTGLGAATQRDVPTESAASPAKPAVQKPAVQKPAIQKPAAQKPAAQKPAAQKPAAPKPAVKPGQSVNAAYIQQVISQAQNGGQQVDPAVLAMLQQAAAKGY
ncbi:transglycosylase family protein [Tsukamurella paurometabola]|nr:transglycosylase family protein [Tsukamurella paurometabola]